MMLMANWMGYVMDVQGAFSNGEFYNGEDLYLRVPEVVKHHYKKD